MQESSDFADTEQISHEGPEFVGCHLALKAIDISDGSSERKF